MNRREAVRRATFLLGGALSMSAFGTFAGVLNPEEGKSFELKSIESQEALIAELANTIIPDRKDIPGAKAAGLGPFIVMMMNDCYTADMQNHFAAGLMKVEEVAQNQFKRSFTVLSLKEREELFKLFKKEAEVQKQTNASGGGPVAPPHFFQLLAELTYLGYYTSEIGATKALRYVHIPGKYEACIPLQPGQKAWAT